MKRILIVCLAFSFLFCDNLKSRSQNNYQGYEPVPDTGTDLAGDPVVDVLRFKGKNLWDPVYYMKIDVYIDHRVRGISDEDVEAMFTTDRIASVNSILYQAGFLIVEVENIYRTRTPSSGYSPDDFIFNNNSSGDAPPLIDDATGNSLSDPGNKFRVYVSNLTGGAGRASVSPRTHAFTVSFEIARNIMAHEIGHIFRLWHTNDEERSPCSNFASYQSLMLNTIFELSWQLTDCEILIMRSYAQRLLDRGPPSWISTTLSGSLDTGKLAGYQYELKDTDPDLRTETMSLNNYTLQGFDADTSASPGIIGPGLSESERRVSNTGVECQNE